MVLTRGLWRPSPVDESILTMVSLSCPTHHNTRRKWRSQTQDLPTASHSSHHDDMATFIRPHCSNRPFTGPLTCSQSGHQPSPTGLATPVRSTKTNLALNDWSRSPAAEPRPQPGVEASSGPFQMASTCGDGYVLSRTCHSMSSMTTMRDQTTLGPSTVGGGSRGWEGGKW